VRVAERRKLSIVETYHDEGLSGFKGRDRRPGFDQMLRDAVRRRFDVLMIWSIDCLSPITIERRRDVFGQRPVTMSLVR
jgi:DNA invertase Pin-like site-specific DNA recombinase